MSNNFEDFLNKFNENDWLQALSELLPAIHEVDRNAVQIWFRFFPLSLYRYLQKTEDKAVAIQKFVMQGNYELKDQIDSSHKFLYGHRFWQNVKEAIINRSSSFNNDSANLSDEVKQIAKTVADKAKVNESLTTAISAIGLMTLTQAGLENFKNSQGKIEAPKGLMKQSPDQIVKERLKDDSQGVLGFLKTVNKKFTVVYDESASDGKFQIINEEELASGSARNQTKKWREMDARCWEGVIPVECRSAACGTCWVGILEGEEKLSEVSRLERKQMKVFGYNQPADDKPFLRLACQAKAFGNVTIAIPSWNGVFGKKVYNNVEEVELEPATTSAAKLRETIASATENN
jgi:ferredoxin